MLVIALGMSLEGAHAYVTSGLPYGESQPLNGGSSPVAYYYDGVTYVVWQGANLGIYVASYTRATRTWSAPVLVASNPLTNDDHGAPAIIVDNSGYIHIMYGSHNSAQKYARSTNPEDISAWTVMPDPVPSTRGATYPHLLKDSSGYLYLLYRSNRVGDDILTDLVESIIRSTDGGATWTAPQDLVNMYRGNENDLVYLLSGGAEYESATNRIDLTWVWDNDTSGNRVNVYYAYLKLNDNNMYSISGTNLGSTIDFTEANTYCKVVDSGTMATNLATVRVDSAGTPYIIYQAQVGSSSWYYKFTRWTGSSWSAPVAIRTSGDDDGAEFLIHSSTSIEAYLVNEDAGSSIEQWSWNGSTWTYVSTVLAPSQWRLEFPTEVVNGIDFKIVFCEVNWSGTGTYTISNLRVFAYETPLIVKRRS
jgi:hypothetical protein